MRTHVERRLVSFCIMLIATKLQFAVCSNCDAIQSLRTHGLIGHALPYCVQGYSIVPQPAADRDHLESFLRRCKRLGFCDVDTQTVVKQF